MTDQQLSSFGERLYRAILAARLSDPALEDLATAIGDRRPWMDLSERTKIAVFVVASKMDGDEETAGASTPSASTAGPPSPVECFGDDELFGAEGAAAAPAAETASIDDLVAEVEGEMAAAIGSVEPIVEAPVAAPEVEPATIEEENLGA